MDDSPSADREPLPISLVAHYVFCPRRAWLEAAGEKTDTYQMAVGIADHGPADDARPDKRERIHAVEVLHPGWGVAGRCDTVEVQPDGSLRVIEHKSTPISRRPEVTPPTKVQLALQVSSLRAMGQRVSGQEVFFTNHRVTVPVELGDADFDRAREAVEGTRRTVDSPEAPPPLEDDPRCMSCSHVSVCLPDERRSAVVSRRIIVADPDTQVVHLATPGTYASVREGRLRVSRHGDEVGSVPLERVQGVVVHGNVDLSGGLLRELLWRSLPIVWCTGSGNVVGWAVSGSAPNGLPRQRQHVASALGRLDIAREMVASKIANQATQLRRNGSVPDRVALLRRLQRRAGGAVSLYDLLGIEGEAAALYFAAFEMMLSERLRAQAGMRFRGRSTRPAQDPISAALNYAYALLVGDLIRAIASCGLDPHAGFLHSSNRNKPALALDLAEEFRAPVADSVVTGAFNNGELTVSDFSSVLGTTRLRERGRKALISAYERRVETKFQHPIFGYEVTWRRAMEVQARMILGVIDGTQKRYVGIKTR